MHYHDIMGKKAPSGQTTPVGWSGGGLLEEVSWRRSPGGGLLEEVSWRRLLVSFSVDPITLTRFRPLSCGPLLWATVLWAPVLWAPPVGPSCGPLSCGPLSCGPLLWAPPVGHCPVGPCPVGPSCGPLLWATVLWAPPVGHCPVGPCPVGPCPVGPSCGPLLWAPPRGPLPVGPSPLWPLTPDLGPRLWPLTPDVGPRQWPLTPDLGVKTLLRPLCCVQVEVKKAEPRDAKAPGQWGSRGILSPPNGWTSAPPTGWTPYGAQGVWVSTTGQTLGYAPGLAAARGTPSQPPSPFSAFLVTGPGFTQGFQQSYSTAPPFAGYSFAAAQTEQFTAVPPPPPTPGTAPLGYAPPTTPTQDLKAPGGLPDFPYGQYGRSSSYCPSTVGMVGPPPTVLLLSAW
uniref:Uncharacterized protein n=1 Tax=Knipowitschia caucasica TaxID=637954 RepID=A0AAV2KP41_KNICA